MGKKGRKKMERKKDFQKVKLKVGKKKPMPDNFTKTAFKSQGILLKEQFRRAGDTQVAKGTIHELLCHVNHYNAKFRSTSLVKLRELLAANRSLVQDNLASLIQNIAHTFTDRDEKARQAGRAVMKQIVIKVESKLIVPFFPALCAHLSCAMTHLQEDIRLDALKILDLLLAHYPTLVIARSHDLLTNFVHQISQQGNRTSGGDIQLSITPGSKFSGQKWRIQVLQRLKAFLSAIVSSKQDTSTDDGGGTQAGSREVIVSSTQEVYVGIYRSSESGHSTESEGSALRSFSHQDELATQDFTSSLADVGKFVQKVIPLLIQSWMEARPGRHSNQASSGDVTLTPVSLEMLHGVLSVLQLLWTWLELLCQESGQFEVFSSIQKQFGKQLVDLFQTGFPYSVHEKKPPRGSQRKSAAVPGKPSDQSGDCLAVNLLLCEVMSYLMREEVKQRWKGRVLEYVTTTLQQQEQVSTEHAQMLLGVVMRMMKNIVKQDSKLELIEGLFAFYKNSHLLSQNKRLAMTCIADITVLDQKMEFKDAAVTADFIETIPQLVLQLGCRSTESSHHALQILHHSAAVGHPSAVSCIQQHFETLLNPETALLEEYPDCSQRQLVQLLHWVGHFSLESLRTMCTSFLRPEVPAATVNYAVQILACKLLRRGEKLPYELSDFISFLITLSLVYQMEDLRQYQLIKLTDQRQLPAEASHLSITKSPDELLIKSQNICPVICQSLGLISDERVTWRLYQDVVCKLLSGITILPAATAYGLLYVVHNCYNGLEATDAFAVQLVRLTASVLHSSLHDYSSDWAEGHWERALWQLAISNLGNRSGLLSNTLYTLSVAVNYHRDTEQLRLVASTVTRLLQAEDLKQVWKQSRSHLSDFMSSLKETTKGLSETRWLAELKYESSLFLGKT